MKHVKKNFLTPYITGSVADPVPGSGSRILDG